MTRPKVSIVLDGLPVDPAVNTSAIDTLASLVAQDYPSAKVEIIACQHGWDSAMLDRLRQRQPNLRVLAAPEGGYYRLKNLGIENARGEIIALADSDCIYAPTWVSEIVATIEAGADVSVGFSSLEGDSLFRRVCSFFDLHQMLIRTSSHLRRFNSSNVAFRADLIQACHYDPRFDRTGGCVELADRLLERGARMQFNPSQLALHSYYGLHRQTWKQAICEGYDFLHTRTLNPKMSLARIARQGPFAPPLLIAALLLADAYNLLQNRRVLRVHWLEVPVFAMASLLMRSTEMIGMYWTLVHPESIARFVDRNFA